MPPNEVPDSDDESGLDDTLFTNSAAPGADSNDVPADLISQDTTQGLDVNFDDFLTHSQSQRAHSSQDGKQDHLVPWGTAATGLGETDGKSTDSTEKLRREIKHVQNHLLEEDSSTDRVINTNNAPVSSDSPTVAKLKRRRIVSAQAGRPTDDNLFNEYEGSRKKRARTETYSKKVRLQGRIAGESDTLNDSCPVDGSLGAPVIEYDGPLQGADSSESEINAFINPMDMHIDPSAPFHPIVATYIDSDEIANNQNGQSRKRGRPRRVVSLLDGTSSTETTHSSMGGYQTYNIDFRNRGNAVNANPFADELSQQTLDEEEGEEHSISVASTDCKNSAQSGSTTEPAASLPGHIKTQLSASAEAASVLSSPATASCRSRPDPTSTLNQGHGTPDRAQVDGESRQKARRNRKRTNTVSSMVSEHTSPEPEHNIEPTAAGSECDQNSHEVGDTTPAPKKRGRKPKPKDVLLSPRVELDEPSTSLHSDDVDIGLPKEQYKPRPSRSRGGTNELSLQKPTTAKGQFGEDRADDSTGKGLSSELNLSDEVSIGLPKEQYKPRPSRSRSKRLEITEDNVLTQPAANSSQQSQKDSDDMPPPPPPSKKEKKASKAKVKRAKTSAAFLKNSDMLDEEDKDVLWLDEKPAAVQMDLPKGDFSPVKKENKGCKSERSVEPEEMLDASETGETGTIEVSRNAQVRKPRLAVEIPAPEPPPATQGPKKRGRQRKKTDDTVIAEESRTEQEQDDQDPNAQPVPRDLNRDSDMTNHPNHFANKNPQTSPPNRLPLAEKSSNVSSSRTTTKHPNIDKSPTTAPPSQENASALQHDHSPPSPPETPPNKDKQQPSTNADAEAAPAPEKGPTKHSPIKAGSLFGSQYRVGLSRRQRIPRLLRVVRK